MSTDRAALASQCPSGYSARNCLSGVVRMEWQLALRESSLPLVVIGLLAFCQLLMPPPDAPYAVLTVNGLKPFMAAGPMILATGAAFSAIAFPAYILYLGRARARDLGAGVGALYLSAPVSTPSRALGVTLGRLLANLALALCSLGLVLVLLLISIRLKADGWPDLAAVIAYFGISVPVILTAACVALVLDATIGNHALKSTLAIGGWFALLGLSVSFQQFDFFGLRFVGENIFPGQPAPSIAVGFIGGKIPTIPWSLIHETSTHLLGRAQFVAAVGGLGFVAAVGLAATFRLRYAPAKWTSSRGLQVGDAPVAVVTAGQAPAQVVSQPLPVWRAVALIAQRRLRRATWAKVLIVTSALIGGGAGDFSIAATTALLIPIALAVRRTTRGREMERVVGFTTPGLWKPTPALLETLAVWGLVVVSVLPSFLRAAVGLPQGAHFLVGSFAASAWLVFTHQVVARELFGVSTYLLLWYFMGCNQLPVTLDLLGIHGTAFVSFLIASALAVGLGLAMVRADYRR